MPGRHGSGVGKRYYLPLLDHLAALPAEQATVTLTYEALATLLGFPLSASARTLTFYWTATAVAWNNWLRDGWTARLDQARGAVTFIRSEP